MMLLVHLFLNFPEAFSKALNRQRLVKYLIEVICDRSFKNVRGVLSHPNSKYREKRNKDRGWIVGTYRDKCNKRCIYVIGQR